MASVPGRGCEATITWPAELHATLVQWATDEALQLHTCLQILIECSCGTVLTQSPVVAGAGSNGKLN